MLELIRNQPDWLGALRVALMRPPDVPERRDGQDPFEGDDAKRPRRIADDLVWLRQAIDEPAGSGLRPLRESAAVGTWEPDEKGADRLRRLSDRHVLEAAGFLLHEDEGALI